MATYSEAMVATQEIQQISDQLKSEVEKKTMKTFTVFTASLYRSLDVTGFIYLIKVDVGGGSAIHLKVYQSPVKAIVLLDVQEGHNKVDPITPF